MIITAGLNYVIFKFLAKFNLVKSAQTNPELESKNWYCSEMHIGVVDLLKWTPHFLIIEEAFLAL
jgi:hypothetical protein